MKGTETIAEKDVSYIREEYRKNPSRDTIKRLAKEKKVPQGRIQFYLGSLADNLREENRKRQQEANEREKDKVIEVRQRNQEISDGKWVISKSITKSTILKVTPDQENSLVQLSFGIKAFTCYVLEAVASEIRPDYNLVKKFLKKNDKLSAKTLDVIQRTKIKTMIQTSIRKPRMANFVIPFQGTHGNTSGNAKIIQKNGKFYLRFNKMDLEVLFQEHDDYYDRRIEIPLRQLFEKGETPSGEILKAKNGNWYARFSLKRKEPIIKFDEDSNPVFMIVQPIYTQIGCKWIAYFYNDKNQLIFKTTILRDVAWLRIPHIEKDYIKIYTNKASEQLMDKSWHKNFMTMKPIVILLDAIGNPPSQTIANLNPTYKFRFRMQDKLAQYNGDGYTLSNCPNNIDEIRSRLSI